MDTTAHLLQENEKRFITETASLLATWGLPPSAGRFLAYLLLQKAPVGLDQIAAHLELSKAGAWNAGRVLETYGHVRRYGTVGSKRALYAVSDNFAAPAVAQASLIEEFEKLLRNCAATVATGEVADQLQARAQFLLMLRNSMTAAIEEWKSNKSRNDEKPE